MSLSFDPLHDLVTKESIRFVGTVGDVLVNVRELYLDVLREFESRVVKTSQELQQRVVSFVGRPIAGAHQTIDVMAALGLLMPISGAMRQNKKFALDEHGLVANALRKHSGFSDPQKRAMLLVRPMFEGNGDYLLQAFEAIDESLDQATALKAFRSKVRDLVDAKLRELPTDMQGAKWNAYISGLKARRNLVLEARVLGSDGGASIAELQNQRKRQEQSAFDLHRKKTGNQPRSSPNPSVAGSETKTLEHHFSRCRNWLLALGFLEASGGRYLPTRRGRAFRDYVGQETNWALPLRIPPSLATLQDCFRLDPLRIKEIWGVVIDDAFWERALLALGGEGSYKPTDAEKYMRFHTAFDAVRIAKISEAGISPMRQVLFLSWLWDGKPVDPADMDSMLIGKTSIPTQHPSEFAYGRNRQGRLAYLFKKAQMSPGTP